MSLARQPEGRFRGYEVRRRVGGWRGRMVDVIYLLAVVASASLVAATNNYLSEPATLALLYSIPVCLAGFRFRYWGAVASTPVAAGLTFLSPTLRPGTLFFDVLVLCVAFVALAGILSAKLGADRATAVAEAPIDQLTGLASHRAIFGALSMELSRCARHGRPLAVLLVGLDDGATSSSKLLLRRLKEVGDFIEGAIRDVDVVGCYGELELLVILPEAGKPDAALVAERIRIAVAHPDAPLPPGRETGNITVSLGVATYTEDSLSIEGLLEAAEEALFEARTLGGNRVRQARRLQVVSHRS